MRGFEDKGYVWGLVQTIYFFVATFLCFYVNYIQEIHPNEQCIQAEAVEGYAHPSCTFTKTRIVVEDDAVILDYIDNTEPMLEHTPLYCDYHESPHYTRYMRLRIRPPDIA